MQLEIQESITQLEVEETKITYLEVADFSVQQEAIPKSIVDAKGDLIVGLGADNPARLAPGPDGTTLVYDSTQATGFKQVGAATGGWIHVHFDGGGATIQANTKVRIPIGRNITVTRVRAFAQQIDATNSIVVDLRKVTYAVFDDTTRPASTDSVCSTSKPTITNGVKMDDNLLTGWTTAWDQGDVVEAIVESATDIKLLDMEIRFDWR